MTARQGNCFISHPAAALLRSVLKCRDFAVALPKLYVVTVYKLLGIFFRGLVVGAKNLDRPEEVAVHADDVCPIFGHLRPPVPRKTNIEIAFCQYGSGLENQKNPVVLLRTKRDHSKGTIHLNG
jgi:hypothetical protein